MFQKLSKKLQQQFLRKKRCFCKQPNTLLTILGSLPCKFVTKNFQKSPNLGTLKDGTIYLWPIIMKAYIINWTKIQKSQFYKNTLNPLGFFLWYSVLIEHFEPSQFFLWYSVLIEHFEPSQFFLRYSVLIEHFLLLWGHS